MSGYDRLSSKRLSGIFVLEQAVYSSWCASFDLAVGKARLRYRSLLFTPISKVALQVESTICHFRLGPTSPFNQQGEWRLDAGMRALAWTPMRNEK